MSMTVLGLLELEKIVALAILAIGASTLSVILDYAKRKRRNAAASPPPLPPPGGEPGFAPRPVRYSGFRAGGMKVALVLGVGILAVVLIANEARLLKVVAERLNDREPVEQAASPPASPLASDLPSAPPLTNPPPLPSWDPVPSGLPRGWDRVRWGASQDEVLAAYPKGRRDDKTISSKPNVFLPRVEVGIGLPLEALFLFDTSGLYSVLLRHRSKSDPVSGFDAYEHLLILLKEKYGNPAIDDQWSKLNRDPETILRETRWQDPHTDIHLVYSGKAKAQSPSLVYLNYQQATPEAEL